MNCTAFREQHFAFMDGELGALQLAEMERHLAECSGCADHDSVVRRAILMARNLPPIEPSADFSSRLEAQIDALSSRPLARLTARTRLYVAPVVGVAAVAYLAVLAFREPARDHLSAFRPLSAAATAPSAPPPALSVATVIRHANDSIVPVSVQRPHFVALQPAFGIAGSTDTFATRLPTPPIMPFGRADLPGAWSRRAAPELRMGGGGVIGENSGGFTAVRLTQ